MRTSLISLATLLVTVPMACRSGFDGNDGGSTESGEDGSSGGDGDGDGDASGDSSGGSSGDGDSTGSSGDGDGDGDGDAMCGDGVHDMGEDCDDGNDALSDGCTPACKDEAITCLPTLLGSYASGNLSDENFGTVTFANGWLLVAEDDWTSPAVFVVDTADPTEPTFQTAYNLNNVEIYQLLGRPDRFFVIGIPQVTAFTIAGNDGALSIHDSLSINQYPSMNAAFLADNLYVPADSSARVVNAGNLDYLATSVSINVPGQMFPFYDGCAAHGTHAYSQVNGVIGSFDVANPAMPIYRSSVLIDDGGGTMKTSEDGNFIFQLGSETLNVYDVTDPTAMSFVAEAPAPDNAFFRGLDVRGEFVYASAALGGVAVFDVADPAMISAAQVFDEGIGEALAIAAGEDFVAVIADGDVHLIGGLPGYCEGVCGNGVVEYGEDCDDGDLVENNDCHNDCT